MFASLVESRVFWGAVGGSVLIVWWLVLRLLRRLRRNGILLELGEIVDRRCSSAWLDHRLFELWLEKHIEGLADLITTIRRAVVPDVQDVLLVVDILDRGFEESMKADGKKELAIVYRLIWPSIVSDIFSLPEDVSRSVRKQLDSQYRPGA